MKIVGLVLASSLLVASAGAFADKQPNMEAALVRLKEAKEALERATHDKGGHRMKAIQLINEASKEVQAGIDYDNTHNTPGEKAPAKPVKK